MGVHDVPRGRWAGVLEQFSRAHRGWLTSVVRVGSGPELLVGTDWHPLESVTARSTGMHVTTICVNLQGGPTVLVRNPRSLGVDRRENGAECGLEIEAAKGPALDIPPEPSAGCQSLLARSARLGPLCGSQRVQNSRNEPHSGPMEKKHVSR